jgi:hypothetical protein
MAQTDLMKISESSLQGMGMRLTILNYTLTQQADLVSWVCEDEMGMSVSGLELLPPNFMYQGMDERLCEYKGVKR